MGRTVYGMNPRYEQTLKLFCLLKAEEGFKVFPLRGPTGALAGEIG